MKRKYNSPTIEWISIQMPAMLAGSIPEPESDPDMGLNDIVADEQM